VTSSCSCCADGNEEELPGEYPDNSDSIGIEIVAKSLDEFGDVYEAPTAQQQQSLQWLIQGLLDTLHLTRTDIYRHPQVSYMKQGEAKDAVW
jgi:N-acetyl-anhydromuramyl-L-alanine amidase AmpD